MIDLSLNNVSKKYRLREVEDSERPSNGTIGRIRNLIRPHTDFWALRNISFTVDRGEAVGIIGHNGAGKSTILKLLAGITTPTVGEIAINGRLSALIEVGSGFHPELTGRENIFLNGSILGMSRREISLKLDRIVDFAGVRPFLDTPVKRFSSGMYVRLGFAIAAHLDPYILLLDEVLAVGDAAFQAKCLQRISELKAAGTTIVFISHDLPAVERTCDRVIVLKGGEVIADCEAHEAIKIYHESQEIPSERVKADESSPTAITRISAAADKFKSGEPIRTGYPFHVQAEFILAEDLPDAVFDVVIYSADREVLITVTTEESEIQLKAGSGSITFSCESLPLLSGVYFIDAAVKSRGAAEAEYWNYKGCIFKVEPGRLGSGSFYMPNTWSLQN